MTSICIPLFLCGTDGRGALDAQHEVEIQCRVSENWECGSDITEKCQDGLDCITGLSCIDCTNERPYLNTSLCVKNEVCEDINNLWFEYTAQHGVNG